MAESITFKAVARRRLPIQGLTVQPYLFGAFHEFDFEGHRLKISLPDLCDDEQFGSLERRSRRIDDPDNPETSFFQVLELILEFELSNDITCNTGVFERPPIAFDLFTGAQQTANRALIAEFDGLFTRAFTYWKSVIRWIMKDHIVGRPEGDRRNPFPGVQHTRILRQSDQRVFWTTGGTAYSKAERAISRDGWRLAQEALHRDEKPPIWFINLHEAHHRLEIGDLTSGLLACAIACETIIRATFWANFAALPNDPIVRLIDRTAIQAILNRWADLAPPALGRDEMSQVRQVFDLRNTLVHDGQISPEELSKIDKLIVAVDRFVVVTDQHIQQKLGLPDRTATPLRH